MYYIIFFILFILSCKEISSNAYSLSIKNKARIFKLLYILLTFVLVFRYGQGTDYFGYKAYYDEVIVTEDNPLTIFIIRSDWGYVCLNILFVKLGIGYKYLIMFVSFLTMYFFYPFFKKVCNQSFFALFVFYCVIFMIYPSSAVRQGLSMAVFFGMMYPLLLQKKFKQYYLWEILAFSFHASSLLFAVFPLIYRFRITNKRAMLIFAVSCIFLVLGSSILLNIPIGFIQSRIQFYTGSESDNSMMPKILRLLMVLPVVIFTFKNYYDKDFAFAKIFILLGFAIYALTSFSFLTSGRLWAYFYGFFCLFLSRLIMIRNKKSCQLMIYFLIIMGFLWFKDINAAIDQGGYRNCNIFTYPYVSIFEGDQTLNLYRNERHYDSNID